MEAIQWILDHSKEISEAITAFCTMVTSIVGFASIVIKLFPVLNKNSKLLPIIKFIGKYLALNRTVQDQNREQLLAEQKKRK